MKIKHKLMTVTCTLLAVALACQNSTSELTPEVVLTEESLSNPLPDLAPVTDAPTETALHPLTVTPHPPTATPHPLAPAPPHRLNLSCKSGNPLPLPENPEITTWEWKVTVTWSDESSDELGFNVYKDGNLLAVVGTNKESYVDVMRVHVQLDQGPSEYGIQSFNHHGASVIRYKELLTCAG